MGLAALSNFHFLHPWWLAALPVFWAFAVWRNLRRRRDGGWAGVIDPQLLPALRLPGGGGGSPWGLLVAAWTIAVLALAGMTWERDRSVGYHAPSDWILVMDLSPSMAAADVPPDRATRARYVIADLLNAAQDTRVALVVFAGEAHTVAPLTTDVETVRALLPPLAPNIMPEPGDDLAPALDEAGRLLHTGTGGRAQVVILTDGILDPAHALDSARRLRAAGATINVVGIGTQSGAPVPRKDGGFQQGPQGESLLSKLPVDQLQRIAQAGGGHYFGVADAGQLIDELKQARIYQARDENIESTAQRVQAWRNDGIWLLPILLLSVALIARRGWPMRNFLTIAFWMLLAANAQASSWSDFWYRPDQQGEHALRAGDAKRAAELFADPRRQAYAELQSQQYAAAAKQLEPFPDAGSQYNRGNALAKSGDLQGALKAYDGALKHTDLDASLRRDAQHNRDLVARQMQGQKDQKDRQQSSNGQQEPKDQADGKPQSNEPKSGSGESQSPTPPAAATSASPSPAEQNKPQDAGNEQRQASEAAQSAKDRDAAAPQASQPPPAAQQANSGRREQSPETASRSGTEQTDSRKAASADSLTPQTEQQLALEQWLRQIPDDPGGLLRRKFMIEHLMKQQQVQP